MPRSGKKKLVDRASALRACPDIKARIAELQAAASAPPGAKLTRRQQAMLGQAAADLHRAVVLFEDIVRQLGLNQDRAG